MEKKTAIIERLYVARLNVRTARACRMRRTLEEF